MDNPCFAKSEISHAELDKENYNSDRNAIKIGSKVQMSNPPGQVFNMVLKDKVIYKINVCPFCGSQATFHHRVQLNNDVIGNVWRMVTNLGEIRKFDYCLDCHKEFLIELYIFEKEK